MGKENPSPEMVRIWADQLEYTPEEERDLKELVPAAELWPFPEPLPPEIAVEMPGEEEVQVIFESFMGPNPSEEWTIEKARAMVNVGRRRLFRAWKMGRE